MYCNGIKGLVSDTQSTYRMYVWMYVSLRIYKKKNGKDGKLITMYLATAKSIRFRSETVLCRFHKCVLHITPSSPTLLISTTMYIQYSTVYIVNTLSSSSQPIHIMTSTPTAKLITLFLKPYQRNAIHPNAKARRVNLNKNSQ